MLTQLNVWLDVVFTTLYAVILVGLSVHFLGNVLTGRAKRRFVGWEWPHHEGGPIPAAPKFMHFQHVAAMIALVHLWHVHPLPVLQRRPHGDALGPLRRDDDRRSST